MRQLKFVFLAGLISVLAGCIGTGDAPAPVVTINCSSASTVGSCAYTSSYFCIDFTGMGWTNGSASSNCTATGTAYTSGGPCTGTGVVGTCIIGAGTSSARIQTYYSPLYTVESAAAACGINGGQVCP